MAELSAGRHLEPKHRPTILRVFGVEVSSLGAGEALGDGEPDSRPPAIGAAPVGFSPVEALGTP